MNQVLRYVIPIGSSELVLPPGTPLSITSEHQHIVVYWLSYAAGAPPSETVRFRVFFVGERFSAKGLRYVGSTTLDTQPCDLYPRSCHVFME